MTNSDNAVIVLAEDQLEHREIVENLAAEAGLKFVTCKTLADAVTAIDRHAAADELCGLVTDLRFYGEEDGWSIICHAIRVSNSLPIALWTALSSDPVQQVFSESNPPFELFAKNASGRKALGQWMAGIRASWDEGLTISLKDANTARLYKEIAPKYADSDLPILIVGESGTGKESLASTIHDTSGRRGLFHPINCGALEPNTALAELFGHTAHAYTDAHCHELGFVLAASGYNAGRPPPPRQPETMPFFDWLESANQDLELSPPRKDGSRLYESKDAERRAGTLFLDEIATLHPKVMAAVLRMLSSGDVRPFGYFGPAFRCYCRIITATNQVNDLLGPDEKDITVGGAFRHDLYYRLAGAVLALLPLRDRDAAEIEHFVKHSVWPRIKWLPPMDLDKRALECIIALYKNPEKGQFGGIINEEIARQYQRGNFRPLLHLVHRAALIADAAGVRVIRFEDVELAIKHGHLQVKDSAADTQVAKIRNVFREVLQSKGIEIAKDFSWQELTRKTKQQKVNCAFAFLEVARITGCEQGPIEKAIAGGTRGKMIGNQRHIGKDDVFQAAKEFYPGFKEKCGNRVSMQIQEIINEISNLSPP